MTSKERLQQSILTTLLLLVAWVALLHWYTNKASLVSTERDMMGKALDAGLSGQWYWDKKTDDLYWDPRIRAMYGFNADEHMTFHKWASAIHPDDSERVLKNLRNAEKLRIPYDVRFRIIVKGSGDVRHIHAFGRSDDPDWGAGMNRLVSAPEEVVDLPMDKRVYADAIDAVQSVLKIRGSKK